MRKETIKSLKRKGWSEEDIQKTEKITRLDWLYNFSLMTSSIFVITIKIGSSIKTPIIMAT